ncbi:MAG: hypothetical protein Q7U59_07680 [Lutibacter sp.]|nr:hypothetical protein [Lutibacter sp.]
MKKAVSNFEAAFLFTIYFGPADLFGGPADLFGGPADLFGGRSPPAGGSGYRYSHFLAAKKP